MMLARIVVIKYNKILLESQDFVFLKKDLNVGDLVEIKRVKKYRTDKQNRLYWLFCQYVAEKLYMTAEEVHEGFKMLHLKETKEINNNIFAYVKSTTELTKDEFSLYIEKCNLTALEFGVDTSEFWAKYYILGGEK